MVIESHNDAAGAEKKASVLREALGSLSSSSFDTAMSFLISAMRASGGTSGRGGRLSWRGGVYESE